MSTSDIPQVPSAAPEFDVYCFPQGMYVAFKVPIEDATLYAEAESKLRPGFDFLVTTSNDVVVMVFRGGKRFLLVQA